MIAIETGTCSESHRVTILPQGRESLGNVFGSILVALNQEGDDPNIEALVAQARLTVDGQDVPGHFGWRGDFIVFVQDEWYWAFADTLLNLAEGKPLEGRRPIHTLKDLAQNWDSMPEKFKSLFDIPAKFNSVPNTCP